jgi:hypothetical protein
VNRDLAIILCAVEEYSSPTGVVTVPGSFLRPAKDCRRYEFRFFLPVAREVLYTEHHIFVRIHEDGAIEPME